MTGLQKRDLLSVLREELGKRKNSNPNYSLRAFSRDLEFSPSLLSKLMNNKNEITPLIARKICEKLDIKEEEKKEILYFYKKNKVKRHIKRMANDELKEIEQATFSIISDWYYYAILEIFNLDYFEPTPEWIAGKLNLKTSIIKEAIDKLLKVKLLDYDSNKNLYCTKNFLTIEKTNDTTTAMKKRMKQISLLSVEKIDKINIDYRDNSAITTCCDVEILPEVKNRILEFRRSLGNFIIKNSKKPNHVYELQINFLPLTDLSC